MQQRVRLDKLLVDTGWFESREKAQEAIESGMLLINGVSLVKPSTMVYKSVSVQFIGNKPFVSRGGIKLAHALQAFKINPQGQTILDIGASTGGFTDCLIKKGASKVYALDVGKGQLDYKLRLEPKVIVLDEVNFRYAEEDLLPEKVDIITIDVSFISLKNILPNTLPFLKEKGIIIALFKPQFEVGPGNVRKGIVVDKFVCFNALMSFKEYVKQIPLIWVDFAPSPIKGHKGNQEYFLLLSRLGTGSEIETTIIKEIVTGGLC